MRNSMFQEKMHPRSITIPTPHAVALTVKGKGNMSEGIRLMVEEHLGDLLEKEKVLREQAAKYINRKSERQKECYRRRVKAADAARSLE